MKILGLQTYRFAPPPPIISITRKIHNICNARLNRFKSTVRHYKTIKFNIKRLLNIGNVQFCDALRAQFVVVATLCAERANIFDIFLTLCPPPPPNPKKWIDAPDYIMIWVRFHNDYQKVQYFTLLWRREWLNGSNVRLRNRGSVVRIRLSRNLTATFL